MVVLGHPPNQAYSRGRKDSFQKQLWRKDFFFLMKLYNLKEGKKWSDHFERSKSEERGNLNLSWTI